MEYFTKTRAAKAALMILTAWLCVAPTSSFAQKRSRVVVPTVICDTCNGKRFNHDTLTVEYKGKSIGEVLMMSVDDAVDFFAAHPRIHHALRLLQDVHSAT